MKLWLDDQRPALEGWVHVRTVAEAQALLVTGEVDEASLDHDLGPDQPDGSALVRWMVETGHWPATPPRVHSMNPAGRERMSGLIERYWSSRTP